MNTSSWVPRLWKPDVFAATNTWWRTVVKISSTSVCEYILSMSSASTKCYRVLELIGTSKFYYCDKLKLLWSCAFLIANMHYFSRVDCKKMTWCVVYKFILLSHKDLCFSSYMKWIVHSQLIVQLRVLGKCFVLLICFHYPPCLFYWCMDHHETKNNL